MDDSTPRGTTKKPARVRFSAVGLALLVVLETLTPAERLAFVLHDMFAVPFDAGLVWAPRARPRVVFGFTITRGKIMRIDLIADRDRLGQLDVLVLAD